MIMLTCAQPVGEIDYNNPFDKLGESCITHWAFVDGGTTVGINYNPGTAGEAPEPAVFNSKLYAIWTETNGTAFQIRVAVFNGDVNSPAWTFVDGNGTNGINYDPGSNAYDPFLAVCNKKLYVAWREDNSGVYQLRVKDYNGDDRSPAWTFVDGGLGTGINYDTSQTISNPVHMTALNAKLYVAWNEINITPPVAQQARMKVYNGTSWTFVDGNPVSEYGLNYDNSRGAFEPRLCVYNSKLYIIWREDNGTAHQVRVAVYNGNDSSPERTMVDGGTTDGINYNPGQTVNDPPWLVVCNSKLYAIWSEYNGSSDNVRVAVYNGNDSDPKWIFVDGNNVNGLNYDLMQDGRKPRINAFNGWLFATWYELPAPNQARIKAFNGNDSNPLWVFLEGKADPTFGINYDNAMSAAYPKLIPFNNRLYAIWYEPSGSANQVRVAVGSCD
jgi:hypothetical protein